MTKNPLDQLTSEFEINDAPLSARNVLTRGHVRDEITQLSGCAVTTRGRYMTPADRLKYPSERALYLYIQGPNKQSLDLAIQKIDEIIRSEHGGAGTKFRANSHFPNSPLVTSVEKVYVGIENVLPSFDLRGKLIGVRGANLNYIRSETGAIVTLRGKGSLFIDPSLGSESSEPLHLFIEHPKHEGLTAAKQLALNLIETLQQEVSQCQPQVIIQPQTQQLQIYPQNAGMQSQVGVLQAQNANMLNFKPNAPPPQLNIPPPGVHIPTHQGPLLPPPAPQMTVPVLNTTDGQTNLTGNPNNMIITSSGQLMTSVSNGSQMSQPLYGTANQNLVQNIQGPNHLQFSQQVQQLQNRQNMQPNAVNLNQYTTTQPEQSSGNLDVGGPQYQLPPPTSQHNSSQLLGFNNVTQYVPAQTQVPQMQIVQTSQPLHILSSQGLTVQNPHFVQQPIHMNQLQTPPGTIQQMNTVQVPSNTPGQVSFQIPIQTQAGSQFIQQQNLQQQTSLLLAQRNLQPQQNVQTIANVPTAQFQLQQQHFQNQMPVMQNVQTNPGQYATQGQMGVYTTQGLVLVQSNHNLQLAGTTVQAMSNFNTQLVPSNQQELNQQNQANMSVQMNLPPPNVQAIPGANGPAVVEQKQESNVSLENLPTQNNSTHNPESAQSTNPPPNLQRVGSFNLNCDGNNVGLSSATFNTHSLQLQQIEQTTQENINTQNIQHFQGHLHLQNQHAMQQMQNTSNFQMQHNATALNPNFQPAPLTNVQEQKAVSPYMIMQQIQNITPDQTNIMQQANQVIVSQNNQTTHTQITFPLQQNQSLSVALAQPPPPPPHQENASAPMNVLASPSIQQHQLQQSIQATDPKQDESNPTRKRRYSQSIDGEDPHPDSQNLKKSGVGDQAQPGSCSTNFNQKGNISQLCQPPIGPSPGNTKSEKPQQCGNQNLMPRTMVRRGLETTENVRNGKLDNASEPSSTMINQEKRPGEPQAFHNQSSNVDLKNVADPTFQSFNAEEWQTMSLGQWNPQESGASDLVSNYQVRHSMSQVNRPNAPVRSNFPPYKYPYNSQVYYRPAYSNQRNPYMDHRRERPMYNQYQGNTMPYFAQNSTRPQGGWAPPQGGWM